MGGKGIFKPVSHHGEGRMSRDRIPDKVPVKDRIGLRAVEIIGIDDGKGTVYQVPCCPHGMARSPGTGSSGRNGESRGQVIQLLKGIGNRNTVGVTIPDRTPESRFNIPPDDKDNFAKAGPHGVENGIIEDRFAGRPHRIQLLQSAVSATHPSGEDEEGRALPVARHRLCRNHRIAEFQQFPPAGKQITRAASPKGAGLNKIQGPVPSGGSGLENPPGSVSLKGMSVYPFRNPDLETGERITDLLGRLTLEEKCSLLRYDAPAVERLGIPAYNWWNEALHGVGRAGRATVFPQAIGMAATFNLRLVETVASAIGDEARAKHHAAAAEGSRQQYQGLTFWTPNINIFRDPRWGRGQETWGEDPWFTGEMGAAFVRGLQGTDRKYLKTAACAKHYAVHSGPEKDRHTFDARPPLKDFEETYLPAFRRLVKEGVESVMGAYNRVYGEPCCGSELLLKTILRERWGFEGHVVSDCWAIRDFHVHHKVTETIEESAALALKNGCDLNCGSVYCDALLDAVNLGYCSEEDVDTSLRRLLRTQFKLGLYDPRERVPYSDIPLSVVNSEAHRKLALETAIESIVLLKNREAALPVRDSDRYMVVVGPHAASVEVLMGNYFGLGSCMTTLLEGIAAEAPPHLRIDYRKGCQADRFNANDMDWSTGEAKNADIIIAAMGIDANIEGEEGDAIQSEYRGDRIDCSLPESQLSYLRALAESIEKRQPKARLVVLLFGGSHLSIPEIHAFADAVLQVWYPGEAGGTAIARVLFGKACPGGRMPITVPRSVDDLPDYEDYRMAGRTYRFMEEEKMLYPFGFGLSYTRFDYGDLTVEAPDSSGEGKDGRVRIPVSNTGGMAGHEVVQVYLERKDREPTDPHLTFVGHEKVFLQPGQTMEVVIPLPGEAFSCYTEEGMRLRAPGTYLVHVGGSLPGKRSRDLGASLLSEASLTIT